MPKNKRQYSSSGSGSDSSSSSPVRKQKGKDDHMTGFLNSVKDHANAPDGSAIKKKMTMLTNANLKRKIFKKLGYEGLDEKKVAPDEIFEFLWKIN